MREGWREVRLGDVATQNVRPFTVDPDTTYVNLGVQWYAGGTFAREPKLGSEMKATRLFEVRPGQFIYNRMFVTEGSFALVAQEHGGGVVSNEFPVFDLKKSTVLPSYLLLHFQQPSVWRDIADQATGTTKSRRRWKEAQFLEYSIALPPLAEQRRIVDLIAAVDDAIEAAEGEAERSIRLLGDVVDVALSEQGDTRAVADLAVQPRGLVGGPFGSSLVRADYREHGVPVIRGVNMPGPMDKEIGGDYVFVDEEKANKLAGNQALPGDVIFTQRGTIGQVGAVPEEPYDRYVVSQSQMRLRVDPLQAIPEYVRFIFTAPSMITGLKAENRATANPHINLGVLAQTRVPVPPVDEQLRLIALWDSIAEAGRTARAHAESLRTLRSNLLTALLSGEHEIPESYDHLLDLAEEGAAA